MDDDDIHDLIGVIYEAPLDPRQWEHVVKRLRGATGSCEGHLYRHAVQDNVATYTSQIHCLALDHERLSLTELAAIGSSANELSITDPYSLHPHPWPEGRAFLGCELIPPSEYKRTVFYNDFARLCDCFQVLVFVVMRQQTPLYHLAFHRSESDPLYGENDKRLIDVFVPHIRRSLNMHGKLQMANTQTTALQNSLDALRSAIVLLNRNGKAIILNAAAGRLIKRCRDLYLRRDRLCARRHVDTLALDQLIRRVLGAGGKRPVGGGVAIQCSSNARPLQVMAAPVPLDSRASLATGMGPVAMLVIHDPSEEALVPQEIVSAMFGLTAAEARLLLALSNGQTLSAFCDEFRVTQNTARTHLKSVFAKTGTKKQSDLVRLMSGLAHSVGMEQC